MKKGLTYALRVLHGRVNELYFGLRTSLLSLFVSKQKLVVATAFFGKKYDDNPRYIVEKIHELSPETEIIWIRDRNTNDSFPEYIHTVSFQNKYELMRALAKASVIIGNNRCFRDLLPCADQMHIETWHGGLGIKKIGEDQTGKKKEYLGFHRAYDFYVSNSDHLTRVYRSAFHYRGPVWKCGYPIEDILLSNQNEREKVHERYSIPEKTHIVLYAPTFREREDSHYKLNVKRIVDVFQQRFGGEWKLFIHWHHFMRQSSSELLGAVEITGASSMQELVKAADAFITDYSSSIFQAVQCHIPCFVYADDYEEYNMVRGMYYPLDEQPFPYALTEETLIDNILHYDSALWDEKWKQYQVRMGHVVTGHSAEDVAKVCVDFLNGKSKSDIMNEIPFETRF